MEVGEGPRGTGGRTAGGRAEGGGWLRVRGGQRVA